MRSAWIGQLVAESLGGGIDSRKEIDLWLLKFHSTIHVLYKGLMCAYLKIERFNFD